MEAVSVKKMIHDANIAINLIRARFMDLNNAFMVMEMDLDVKNVGIISGKIFCSLIDS